MRWQRDGLMMAMRWPHDGNALAMWWPCDSNPMATWHVPRLPPKDVCAMPSMMMVIMMMTTCLQGPEPVPGVAYPTQLCKL